MDCVIDVQDLHREFVTSKGWVHRKKERVKAVDGISFQVKRGEVFGLLGQNGAGKTTTIKMLITLLAPTKGKCEVLGFDTFSQEKKIRNRINFIFGGELGLYRRLSARDNLKYFACLYHIGQEEADSRTARILELVGLSEKADILVETFSKGMIQRLQIARGLLNDPEILFMDEPTVGLDPLGARMLRDIIRTLKEEGKTILLTTHYMYEADELCDRIAILNHGKLVAIDTPANLKKLAEEEEVIEIRLEYPMENKVKEIEMIQGVKQAVLQQDEKDCLLTVKYSAGAEIIEAVMEILKGTKVHSFSNREITLEDVYIKMLEGLS
ncbi:ABC transporter ATP-binding protein [Anaerocolumna xylanovorans]|uniref:ABC-2 type transport system ATP-binding protein n=1 Tax=Anaerocolumna xylanovorans DSM 12503 TaxID=1121345 RepID=A0A1M7YNI6_9FIRM|nr:ABC transporter ATP-binding protein [Anaerocolumna xylanovorans]SHO54108.1 ABC-2 type transport system ATP-binding protein [Anaerocolumna xylanovorans DSM 12503]